MQTSVPLQTSVPIVSAESPATGSPGSLLRVCRGSLLCLLLGALFACGPGGQEGGAGAPAPQQAEAAESAQDAAPVEAVSLLGDELRRPELPDDTRRDFEAKLEQARADLAADPDSADALVWVGRRTAYLGRYGDAIEIFAQGVERFPEDPRFLRHRGHRYITTRRLDRAVEDLAAAYAMIQEREDEVEPDGLPNDRGIPTSTLQSNIRYHLALAHVLRGEFEDALPLWREDVEKAANPDMRAASTYWLVLTLRRLGRDEEAREVLERVDADAEIIENHDYHRLLLAFRGDLDRASLLPEDATELAGSTVGYGLATWDLVEGRRDQAMEAYRAILESPGWAAFGYIAAEAEVARADPAR